MVFLVLCVCVCVWSSGSGGGGDKMNKRWSNKYGGMDYYLHSTFENIRSLSMSMWIIEPCVCVVG